MEYSFNDIDVSSSSDITAFGEIMGIFGAFFGVVLLISLAISVLMIISQWKVLKKAGKQGWEAIIPIYNIIVMFQIAKINPLWVLLAFSGIVPVVGFIGEIFYLVVAIVAYNRIANALGKGTGFTIGMILVPVIFWPLLGFGHDTWDDSRINLNSMSFLNAKEAQAAPAAAPAAAPTAAPTQQDSWVSGQDNNTQA